MLCIYAAKCLLNGAGNTLPVLRDFNFPEISEKIIRHHQVIVHNFRFQCCGNITAWGADVFPGRDLQQNRYTIDFQVWRPSPTMDDSIGAGQYSLVGNNKFTSISLLNMDNYLVRVTPSPQDYIQFQPGDVLGFYVEEAMSVSDGVVLITTSRFSNESVWQASVDPTIATIQTVYSIGVSGVLNTAISGAPVISVNVESKTGQCVLYLIQIMYYATKVSFLTIIPSFSQTPTFVLHHKLWLEVQL